MQDSLVTQSDLLSLWRRQGYNLLCLATSSPYEELRAEISESGDVVISVSWIKIVRRWCQTHLGFGFYLWARCSIHCLTSSTAATMWLSPGPPAGWCGPLSSLLQLPTMHGGLCGLLFFVLLSRTKNACKGSSWQPIRRQIKPWASCWCLDIRPEQRYID